MSIWALEHKGHSIRIEDVAFLGERLFLDGVRSKVPRPLFRSEVRGQLQGGEGDGAEVIAKISGVSRDRCTLTINGEKLVPRPLPDGRDPIRFWAAAASWGFLFASIARDQRTAWVWVAGTLLVIWLFSAAIQSTQRYRQALQEERASGSVPSS